MEDLNMTDEELEQLLLFTKEEEEFMVVPTLENSPIPLEDLPWDETFNGLTVDILQNPSGVFVVDVDQTSSNHDSIGNGVGNGNGQNFVQYNNNNQSQQQFGYQQQQQFFYGSSDNKNNVYGQVNGIEYQHVPPQFSPQQSQKQFSELGDPTANWVAQTADVTILERLDDILDIVPQSAPSTYDYNSQSGSIDSPVLDKKQILEEIYREAEEISSRRESPAVFSSASSETSGGDLWERSVSASFDSDQSMDSYHPPEKINFDHIFGLAAVEKKSKKTTGAKSEKAPKREVAKQKKRHQNREAALRYRLKKRAEKAATNGELGELMERNEFLKSQRSNLASEIAYLKGLLSEVHKKKQIRS